MTKSLLADKMRIQMMDKQDCRAVAIVARDAHRLTQYGEENL